MDYIPGNLKLFWLFFVVISCLPLILAFWQQSKANKKGH